jgi:hypothetical protein
MRTAKEIHALVEGELAHLDPIRQDALRSLLTTPRMQLRDWEYGSPGQQFECWIVGEVPDCDMQLAYCEEGFGPTDPWGVVARSTCSIGMDSQWYETLEEVCSAFLEEWLQPKGTDD